MNLQTLRLELRPKTRADVQAMIDKMTPNERAQISAKWMTMFRAAETANPWIFGFSAVLPDREVIGTGGFTGPPESGTVEIAYAVEEQYRGKGYATEIAQALTEYAFACEDVHVVRAHTLPDGAASQRILAKCGFRHVGEINDPEDGLIWRFEKPR